MPPSFSTSSWGKAPRSNQLQSWYDTKLGDEPLSSSFQEKYQTNRLLDDRSRRPRYDSPDFPLQPGYDYPGFPLQPGYHPQDHAQRYEAHSSSRDYPGGPQYSKMSEMGPKQRPRTASVDKYRQYHLQQYQYSATPPGGYREGPQGSLQSEAQPHDCLQVLVTPDDADVDIVFVHGIGTMNDDSQINGRDTWMHENGTLWPQLLLPQLLPSARIMLFEYPLEIGFNRYIRAVSGLGTSLLDRIVEVRQKQEQLHRPLVFIAHSFAGLCVREALFNASSQPQYSCLGASTYGIVCFATPRKNYSVDMALEIRSLVTGRPVDALDAYFEPLKPPDRDVLLDNSYDPSIHLVAYRILAFYEQRKVTDGSSEIGMVYDVDRPLIPSSMAMATNETSVKVNRDHFDICKFSGVEDPEYQLVATYLERMVNEARQHQVKCKNHLSTSNDVLSPSKVNRASTFSPTSYQDSDDSEVCSLDESGERPSYYWSQKLGSALDTGNLTLARNLLHEYFELVASDNFVWLHELRDLGYSFDEIAEVLMNERNDSPWIYFKPRSHPPRSVVADFHQPYCVHESVPVIQDAKASTNKSESRSKQLVENRHSSASDDDTTYLMEELCGLAGILPTGRDPREWNGQATFGKDKDNMTVSIHFLSRDMVGPTSQARYESSDSPRIPPRNILADLGPSLSSGKLPLNPKKNSADSFKKKWIKPLGEQLDAQQSDVVGYTDSSQTHRGPLYTYLEPSYRYVDLARLIRNVLNAFQGFYSAVAEAQHLGICCNSFTILRNLDRRKQAVELYRIELQSGVSLFRDLKKATYMSQKTRLINKVAAQAETLCRPFSGNQTFHAPLWIADQNHNNIAAMLHYSALAIQLLSLGFLSYIRAHVGAFHPFFLDTTVETVHLHGIYDPAKSLPQISASLQRLTCLEDMIQKPVVVFGSYRSSRKSVSKRYDLLTTPEDFLDTWGPGQYVFANTSDASGTLSAIMIGGGSVKPVAEDIKTLHWSKDLDPRHDSSITFNTNSIIRIGLGVDQNLACAMNLSNRLPVFRELLENLGTNDDYWAFTELQVGLAITGQQLVGAQAQLNKTWTWHEGNTWKTRYFNNISFEINYQELEKPWGLQVSFCTGVARRVPLRLLLADVMPTFANGLAIKSIWAELESKGIIAAFKGTQLQQWLNELETHPQDLGITVNRLVRYILYKLRDTGIDRTRKVFVVASPEDDKPLSPISMCLKVPCEKTALWAKILEDSPNCATFACMTTTCLETAEHRCRAREPWDCPSLETAVCRHRSRKEPPVPQNRPWHLENQRAYWIGRPDSGLLARVGTVPGTYVPRLYISVSMMSSKLLARLGAMGHMSEHHKRGHIREKQVASWPAEDVIILSKESR